MWANRSAIEESEGRTLTGRLGSWLDASVSGLHSCYAGLGCVWPILKILGVNALMSEPVKITVRPNGPLRVEGPIVLVDADGKEWDLTGKPAVSLCRCGASEKRPFCDGAHNRVGFQCMASPANLT
jgi:CDGSH-type Zn-finger protein